MKRPPICRQENKESKNRNDILNSKSQKMSLEQMSKFGQDKKEESSNPKNFDKKSLELEKMNRLAENASDPEIKEAMIQKMDQLNETIAELEKKSGLPAEEILDNYTRLNKQLAEGGDINKLIENLAKELPTEEKTAFLQAVKNGATEAIVNIFKKNNPKRTAVATALALTLFTGAVGNANVVRAQEYSGNRQQIEMVKKIETPAQAWEYLLSTDKKDFFKALEKIKNDLDIGRNEKGFAGIIHYLSVAKKMGVSAYAKSLGLDYYQLDEEGKKRAEQGFERMLQQKGIAEYFKLAEKIKKEKNSHEATRLAEVEKWEKKLKTPLIERLEKEASEDDLKAINMGLSAHRERLLGQGLSPQEVAQEITRLKEQQAQKYFSERK